MRGRNLCKSCPRRGRVAVGQCNKCNALYCEYHGEWHDDQWLCVKCVRAQRKAK